LLVQTKGPVLDPTPVTTHMNFILCNIILRIQTHDKIAVPSHCVQYHVLIFLYKARLIAHNFQYVVVIGKSASSATEGTRSTFYISCMLAEDVLCGETNDVNKQHVPSYYRKRVLLSTMFN
jgi:hypothetical protein